MSDTSSLPDAASDYGSLFDYSSSDDDNLSESEETPTPPESRAPSPTNDPTAYDPRPTQANSPTSALAALLLNPEYADFTIKVEDKVFPAHKNVVCSQSEFFKLALRGGFREAEEATVTITDESAKTIHRLLTYLYTGNYREYPTSAYTSGKAATYTPHHYTDVPSPHIHYATRVNLRLHLLADKYGIPALSTLGCEKQHTLMRAANLVLEDAWICRQVYSATTKRDDPMRVVCRDHLISLRGPLMDARWDVETVRVEGELRRLVREQGDFAWEWVLQLIRQVDGKEEEISKIWDEKREVLERERKLKERVDVLKKMVAARDREIKRLKRVRGDEGGST
ncbi:hypothetical protein BJ508DRAFT_418290 [Ascobolus immersus RN42]|uniref:BTB domain-containing protein n=1 Tax=Ascobolus immersus RN42 TaxID=1160509 RepID=A0A3N4HQ69_ASCIM|nr:hypothetical protein BJ508DRAFT_418290 [Ascobolus immersus RN42]